MKRIEVSASGSYEVIIGENLLGQAGRLIREAVGAKTVMIVTDDIVNGLYADTLEYSLKEAGFDCRKFVFKNGEGSKNLRTYGDMLEFAAENRLTRGDCIVALGGGVVGDTAGFCAATYLRGISLIQIPTTLLATVDSSVGGKTALDLRGGKNLVGAFYQPSLVIADVGTLSTLPDRVFADGMAETVKYGILFDRGFFDFLGENDAKKNLEYIAGKSVRFKRDIVVADEKESGIRALLNLGHTVGHAVEKCSGYTVSHGAAVAIGTVVISKGAAACSLCDSGVSPQIIDLYKKYGLPVETEFSAQELFEACLNDKKRNADGITLVIPENIGKCRLLKTDFEQLKQIIEKGLV